jgi:hypothetical protein
MRGEGTAHTARAPSHGRAQVVCPHRLDEIRADESCAVLIIAKEQGLLERERGPGQHAR